jgi:protein involved in polysaccharide export with SLBB domain
MTDRAKPLLWAVLAGGLILVFGPGAVAGAQTNAPAPASVAPATPVANASTAPAKTIRVQVLGAVLRPGYVDVADGDRLSVALARAGVAVETRADLRRIVLVRANPENGKPAPIYQIDVYQALRRGDQRFDPILHADDKIYVPESRTPGLSPLQIADATFEAVAPQSTEMQTLQE